MKVHHPEDNVYIHSKYCAEEAVLAARLDGEVYEMNAKLEKDGKIEFLGCILDAVTPDSVRSLDAFLLHSGLDLPIGIDRDNVDFISDARYQNHLTQLLPSKYNSENEAEGVFTADCSPTRRKKCISLPSASNR